MVAEQIQQLEQLISQLQRQLQPGRCRLPSPPFSRQCSSVEQALDELKATIRHLAAPSACNKNVTDLQYALARFEQMYNILANLRG